MNAYYPKLDNGSIQKIQLSTIVKKFIIKLGIWSFTTYAVVLTDDHISLFRKYHQKFVLRKRITFSKLSAIHLFDDHFAL